MRSPSAACWKRWSRGWERARRFDWWRMRATPQPIRFTFAQEEFLGKIDLENSSRTSPSHLPQRGSVAGPLMQEFEGHRSEDIGNGRLQCFGRRLARRIEPGCRG